MKKTLLFTMVTLLSVVAFAQIPASFNYQAIARDANGKLIQDKNVSLRITILQDSATGTSLYQESHKVMTNKYGLVNLAVGGGSVVSGTFTTINWGGKKTFIKVDMDASGGSAYTDMGTQQLLAVPYAMTADKVVNSDNSNTNEIQTPKLTTNSLGLSGTNTTVNLSKFLDSKWKGSTTLYNSTATTFGMGTSNPSSLGLLSMYPRANRFGIYMDHNHTNAGATYGINIDLDNTYTSSGNTYGIHADAYKSGGGGYVTGGSFNGRNYNTSGTGNTFGLNVYSLRSSASPSTNCYGIYVYQGGNAPIEYGAYIVGRAYASSHVTPSDENLKENISLVNSSLDKLMSLPVKTYDYKLKEYSHMNLPEGNQVGIMAQDLESNYPELVSVAVQPALSDVQQEDILAIGEVVPIKGKSEVKFKAVNYTGLVPHLVKGMQEQQVLINNQNNKIESQKTELQLLKEKIAKQEVMLLEMQATLLKLQTK